MNRKDTSIDSLNAINLESEKDIKTSFEYVQYLENRLKKVEDVTEMLWMMLANVSGGDWDKQTPEWKEAVIECRDNYFEAIRRYPEDGKLRGINKYVSELKDDDNTPLNCSSQSMEGIKE